MLHKRKIIDSVEILDCGGINVRESTEIIEDGKVISKIFSRYGIDKGNDIPESVKKYLSERL